jgi:thiol:disulfide interchange protein
MRKTIMPVILLGLALGLLFSAGCPVNTAPGASSGVSSGAATTAVGDGQDHLKWWTTLADGLQQDASTKKPLVVDVGAEWCGWCKKMAAESFPDPSVQALADKFVWVRVDADKEPTTSQKYRVEGLPTILVLLPDGTESSRLTGYVKGSELADFLTQAAQKAQS